MVRWVVGSILHRGPIELYFSFQPVLHDWCNKGCGMCYPVCGMVLIKEPLLLIGKSSLCGGSGFPFLLSEWSLTICLTHFLPSSECLGVCSMNKEMFYLTTHSTHFILRLYGIGHMVEEHSDSERGNLLPPHELLFLINSKGSFIHTIPQTGYHIPQPLLHQSWSTDWNEK